ncbi:MAG: hypothetical protein ACRCVJ_11785 [Clostridium sp.]|uniref:hypothetical protein n=1 Tax=Clostridium sp. TaxID=1506 RepID=UPI003F40B45C
MKTYGFYILANKINELEDELSKFQISELQEKVKKLPKKSEERKELNLRIKEIKQSREYELLIKEKDTVEWCMNRSLLEG